MPYVLTNTCFMQKGHAVCGVYSTLANLTAAMKAYVSENQIDHENPYWQFTAAYYSENTCVDHPHEYYSFDKTCAVITTKPWLFV